MNLDARTHQAPVLDVRGLTVELPGVSGPVTVVDDVDLTIRRGETVGLVGESGAGKSMTTLAITGLVPSSARVFGSALFGGRDLLALGENELRRIRGSEIGMIFQEPRRSLNPAFTVGEQVAEVLRRHRRLPRARAWQAAVELLDRVSIPRAAARAHDYPHQFSGGMCQRAMLAMAVACEPRVLIADEPTTALDVTVQRQMLELIAKLQADLDLAVLFVTHDLSIVAEVCHRVAVMYCGQIVESGPVGDVFASPRQPYTAGLLAALPTLRHRGERFTSIAGSVPRPGSVPAGCRFHPRCPHSVEHLCTELPVPLVNNGDRQCRCARADDDLALVGVGAVTSSVEGQRRRPSPGTVLLARTLTKSFRGSYGRRRRRDAEVAAVRGVDLAVGDGETLAVVGETGAGKSTVGRMVLGLELPDAGTIELFGRDIADMSRSARRAVHKSATMIFQDPYSSFDPRMAVGASVGDPLTIHLGARGRRNDELVAALLSQVGLDGGYAHRYPAELSGGELQRAAIARAIGTRPRLIVCDEPVAALDMSVRAQVLNLLRDLQAELGIAYLFISHDLALVRVIADRVAVMRAGEIVELADADTLFRSPNHEYTAALLAAIPSPDPSRPRLHARATDQRAGAGAGGGTIPERDLA